MDAYDFCNPQRDNAYAARQVHHAVYCPAFTASHCQSMQGWPGWVHLGGRLHTFYPSTNCRATMLSNTNALSLRQTRNISHYWYGHNKITEFTKAVNFGICHELFCLLQDQAYAVYFPTFTASQSTQGWLGWVHLGGRLHTFTRPLTGHAAEQLCWATAMHYRQNITLLAWPTSTDNDYQNHSNVSRHVRIFQLEFRGTATDVSVEYHLHLQ